MLHYIIVFPLISILTLLIIYCTGVSFVKLYVFNFNRFRLCVEHLVLTFLMLISFSWLNNPSKTSLWMTPHTTSRSLIYTTLDVLLTLLTFQHALRLLLALSCLLRPEICVTNLEVAQNGQKTVASDLVFKVWDEAMQGRFLTKAYVEITIHYFFQ